VIVYGRSAHRAALYAREMSERFALAIEGIDSAQRAVESSDIVVTTTPSREPLLRAGWLRPGIHVTAMGSDRHDKREPESVAFARADKLVADRLD